MVIFERNLKLGGAHSGSTPYWHPGPNSEHVSLLPFSLGANIGRWPVSRRPYCKRRGCQEGRWLFFSIASNYWERRVIWAHPQEPEITSKKAFSIRAGGKRSILGFTLKGVTHQTVYRCVEILGTECTPSHRFRLLVIMFTALKSMDVTQRVTSPLMKCTMALSIALAVLYLACNAVVFRPGITCPGVASLEPSIVGLVSFVNRPPLGMNCELIRYAHSLWA